MWHKCLDFDHPAVVAAESAVGEHGAFQALKATQTAIKLEICHPEEVTADMVARWAGVKRDRAARLLPFVLDLLQETVKISKNLCKISKNLPKISENLSEISENLVDFDSSNQHGSTRDLERENREKEIPPLPPTGGESVRSLPAFEKFWDKYPSKVGKKPAREAWLRKKLDARLEEILAGIERLRTSERWKEGYIPNPTTFINQERWQDDLTPAKSFVTPPPQPKPRTRADVLAPFQVIVHRGNGQRIAVEDIEKPDTQPGAWFYKGERLNLSMFDGVKGDELSRGPLLA